MTCLFDGRFSPAEEVMERCGGRKAVWCIDTSVVLGMHVSFCLFVFSNFINSLIGDSLALYLCTFFDGQQIRLWSGHVCM